MVVNKSKIERGSDTIKHCLRVEKSIICNAKSVVQFAFCSFFTFSWKVPGLNDFHKHDEICIFDLCLAGEIFTLLFFGCISQCEIIQHRITISATQTDKTEANNKIFVNALKIEQQKYILNHVQYKQARSETQNNTYSSLSVLFLYYYYKCLLFLLWF